ncbi:hypothetical protein V5N11_013059 [Cardamine amara subsp. amara]|uniref:Uncharacterized protein n=1 Tax=Cardamine amara subsp. amara TaxID=228776 RepID=A0ABD0ZYX5_CARAN
MLLTDVDPSRRLFAGSRLRITKLGDSMLEAAFGMRAEKYLIPKTHMYSPQKFFSTLRRTQFPVILAFAMPINKSQPLSFSKVVQDQSCLRDKGILPYPKPRPELVLKFLSQVKMGNPKKMWRMLCSRTCFRTFSQTCVVSAKHVLFQPNIVIGH